MCQEQWLKTKYIFLIISHNVTRSPKFYDRCVDIGHGSTEEAGYLEQRMERYVRWQHLHIREHLSTALNDVQNSAKERR